VVRFGHGTRLVAWLRGYPAMLKDLARDLNPDRSGRGSVADLHF
jgi:hypothetical protein